MDPESFVREGPTFFLEGREDPNKYHHYKQAVMDPPAKRHSNGVLLARLWWPNIECRIGRFVI